MISFSHDGIAASADLFDVLARLSDRHEAKRQINELEGRKQDFLASIPTLLDCLGVKPLAQADGDPGDETKSFMVICDTCGDYTYRTDPDDLGKCSSCDSVLRVSNGLRLRLSL